MTQSFDVCRELNATQGVYWSCSTTHVPGLQHFCCPLIFSTLSSYPESHQIKLAPPGFGKACRHSPRYIYVQWRHLDDIKLTCIRTKNQTKLSCKASRLNIPTDHYVFQILRWQADPRGLVKEGFTAMMWTGPAIPAFSCAHGQYMDSYMKKSTC